VNGPPPIPLSTNWSTPDGRKGRIAVANRQKSVAVYGDATINTQNRFEASLGQRGAEDRLDEINLPAIERPSKASRSSSKCPGQR
jgi:hypothetical protein